MPSLLAVNWKVCDSIVRVNVLRLCLGLSFPRPRRVSMLLNGRCNRDFYWTPSVGWRSCTHKNHSKRLTATMERQQRHFACYSLQVPPHPFFFLTFRFAYP